MMEALRVMTCFKVSLSTHNWDSAFTFGFYCIKIQLIIMETYPMRLEIIIDRKHQIPTATMEALRQELLKQLGERFPDLHVRVAPGSAMALTVSRASKEDRELAETMVQEVWENAESWMPEAEGAEA